MATQAIGESEQRIRNEMVGPHLGHSRWFEPFVIQWLDENENYQEISCGWKDKKDGVRKSDHHQTSPHTVASTSEVHEINLGQNCRRMRPVSGKHVHRCLVHSIDGSFVPVK